MSEANKDGSEQAIDLSRKEYENGNMESALRYAEKAARLFPSEESNAWLSYVRAQSREAGSSSKAAPYRTKYSGFRDGEAVNPNIKRKDGSEMGQKSYTNEQVAQVKKQLAINRDDYYAVLGIPKDSDDVDIKKAYRKVS